MPDLIAEAEVETPEPPQNASLKLKAFAQYVDEIQQNKGKIARDSSFDAASFMIPALEGYFPVSLPGDEELNLSERKVIIPRCRDAYNNDLLGKAAINRIVEGSVGVKGLTAKPKIDREITELTKKEARRLTKIISKKWKRWSKKQNCDISGERSFTELLRTAQLQKLVDGDLLVNTISRKFRDEEFFLKLQLIEGERVSNNGDFPDLPASVGQRGIVQGIEHDLFGRHFAYWVRQRHPGTRNALGDSYVWSRLPVYGGNSNRRRVFFLKPWGRLDMKRGVPFLAVALEKLRTIKQYSRHHLFTAAIQALYTVFVKNVRESEDSTHSENNNTTIREGQNKVQLGSGLIQYLQENEDVVFPNPTAPNSQYEAFLFTQIKELGAGFGIPFEYLISVFNTSYTAARASFLQAEMTIDINRFDLINDLCINIWELFLDELVETDSLPEELVDVDEYFNDFDYRDAIQDVAFVGSKLGSIDEIRDAQAAGLRVDKGFNNIDSEITKLHGDTTFEEVTEKLGEELQARRKAGITEFQTPGITAAKIAIAAPQDVIDDLEEGIAEEEEGEAEDET